MGLGFRLGAFRKEARSGGACTLLGRKPLIHVAAAPQVLVQRSPGGVGGAAASPARYVQAGAQFLEES